MFVTALSALAFGLCAWKARDFHAHRAPSDLAYSACAFLAGALVIWYGRRVFKKLKSISYL